MGMYLIPRNRGVDSISYNWSGWGFLCQFAEDHGVDTSEFDGCNDGRLIRAATCRSLAATILDNKEEYNEAFAGNSYGPDPATKHAELFLRSSGMRQF